MKKYLKMIIWYVVIILPHFFAWYSIIPQYGDELTVFRPIAIIILSYSLFSIILNAIFFEKAHKAVVGIIAFFMNSLMFCLIAGKMVLGIYLVYVVFLLLLGLLGSRIIKFVKKR